MFKNKKNSNSLTLKGSYFLLGLSLLATLITISLVYTNIKWFFEWSLREHVLSTVSTAALNFKTSSLDKITSIDSVDSPEYREAVFSLQKIRVVNNNVKFAYIQRKTQDPLILRFVADADSINPDAQVDLNFDGVIDESDQLNFPGQEYDVSEYPDFAEVAFNKPYVDEELSVDQWGTHLSATAPINSDYVLGIDVDASNYSRFINITFTPFLLFGAFLVLILTYLTVSLTRIWKEKVDIVNELDKQKDELLGLVSHQLATPVSSIKWYLEMLGDGDLGDLNQEQKEHVKSMQGIGNSMSDLVGMILDVSRIQLGKMRIEKQSLDLKEFFHELVATIEPKAMGKKVEFVKNIPTDFPAAQLDRRYTNMTIENLLSNAVKYTPEGGRVMLDVSINEDMMCVRVSDTGMGIPKAEQAKIFGRMFRASNARNAIDGNGFGLFVAKGAVEAQGGKIWFDSEEGKGTTFCVDLPLA